MAGPSPTSAMNFGPYSIIRRLAVGGMSEVFLARHTGIEGLERRVVIKRIRQGLSKDEEFRTMFLDEARLMAALSHPNIAQVFDLGQMEESYHLVMEYVRGPTLNTLLHAASKHGYRAFPLGTALGIALGITEALAYVHARRDELGRPLRIIHRDLKPANIIVSYDGAVKLIDFGIAKAASKVYETRTGVIKGTYGYIAPEQLARGAVVDHRVDVFAMGVILYEMCVGAHPFDISDEPNLLDRILNAKYVRPRKASPEIPKSLDRLIASCLAPHPEGRPEDMKALVKLIIDEQLNLGLRSSMADVAELVRQLVQDTDGPAPVKSLTELKYPQFEYALPGYSEGSVKTAAEGHHPHVPIDVSEEEGTQRMSAANIVALGHTPLGHKETSVPSWEEAQTMVADAAFIEGPTITSIGRDVDWSAPDSKPPRKRSAVMWPAIALGALLIVGAVLLVVMLRSSQAGPADAQGHFESKSLTASRPKITGDPSDPAVVHAAGTRTIEIVSDPPGAAILINGALQPEVTPAKIRVAATQQALRIKLTKEGYSDHESEFPQGAPSLVVLLTPLDQSAATDPDESAAADPGSKPQDTLEEATPEPAKTPRRRRRRR